MTDVLRETLEERGRATPWEDVDALVAAGDRQVRRRRVVGVVAAAAAVAVLAVLTPLALGGLGPDRTRIASETFDPAAPSWAVGGVVHVGDLEVDLGQQPHAYVVTDAGVVWIAPSGDVVLTEPTGGNKAIGTSDDSTGRALVTDGRYVAWLDRQAQEIVEYDTASREVVGGDTFANLPGNGRLRTPRLVAIDRGELWWFDTDARETSVVQEPEGGSETVVSYTDGGRAPLDVASGHVATSTDTRFVRIQPPGFDARGSRVPGRDEAILSAGGTYVVTRPRRDFVVFDVRTATPLFRLSPEDSKAPVRWLDDDTLEVLLASTDGVDLATCRLPMAACSILVEDVAPSPAQVAVSDGIFRRG